MANATRTVGKTPVMAFVLDYLREFPGAGYARVKKAALSHGLASPAPVIYGNALRVLRKESAPPADPVTPPPPRSRSVRRRTSTRGISDLAGLVEQMQEVVAERDRLRIAVEDIGRVVKQMRR